MCKTTLGLCYVSWGVVYTWKDSHELNNSHIQMASEDECHIVLRIHIVGGQRSLGIALPFLPPPHD